MFNIHHVKWYNERKRCQLLLYESDKNILLSPISVTEKTKTKSSWCWAVLIWKKTVRKLFWANEMQLKHLSHQTFIPLISRSCYLVVFLIEKHQWIYLSINKYNSFILTQRSVPLKRIYENQNNKVILIRFTFFSHICSKSAYNSGEPVKMIVGKRSQNAQI